MTEGVILMAKTTGGFAVTSGFISHDTKQMLDKINVR